MKRYSFFIAALIGIGWTACSNETEFEEISPSPVATYMTVTVTDAHAPLARTLSDKTLPGEGTETGTEAETKITNLMVLLYDESNVLKKTYVTTTMKNTEEGAQTAVFPMATGTYQVYAIANFSDREAAWEALPGLDVKQQTIEEVTQQLMKRSYAKDHQFIMFNACNGKDRTAGVPIEISAVHTAKNPATCTLSLDRLAVKIRSQMGALDLSELKADLPETYFKDVSVVSKGFKLMNGARQTYLQQRWTNDEPAVYPYQNTLVTPWLSGEEKAPVFNYYAKYADFRTITLDANGKYEYVRDNYALMDFYDNASGPIYCMENNPTWNGTSVVDALKGNTTGLVYQFLLNFKGSDELAGSNSFYAYGGRFFPSLKAIQEVYPYVFDDASPSAVPEEDLAAAEDELKRAYATPDLYDGVATFRAKYQIKVYMDGLMYYIYYIKDRNYLEGDNPYYAVMRNSVYDLTVNSLLRVGDDIPGGWNPDTRPVDPVDPTQTYMNVTVKVNPWVLNREDIDLK